jgi:lysophospholipase L1-like esterase
MRGMKPTPLRVATLIGCLLLLIASITIVAQTRPTAVPSDAATTTATTAPAVQGPARWEKRIAAYEQADRAAPPPKGGVLFIGSSTIGMWKSLAADFPDHPVINRGFGGSQIADATHFADRIIVPYEPAAIFLRSGTNDIHAGKSPEQVAADFQAFVETVRARLPETQIVFTSINSAPSRWHERDAVRAANALIADYCRRTPGVKYVETYDMVIGPDGELRPELFLPDRLHFNAEGYKVLADRVRPHLPDPAAARVPASRAR